MANCAHEGCRWPVFANGRCLGHAAAAGDAAALEEQRKRAAKGRAAVAAGPERTRVPKLRTMADLLGVLERALRTAESSGGDKVQRAKAVVAIVAEARAVLKAAELEDENRLLRDLLWERMPELRKHLRVVRDA